MNNERAAVLGLGSWVLGLGSWVLGLGSWENCVLKATADHKFDTHINSAQQNGFLV